MADSYGMSAYASGADLCLTGRRHTGRTVPREKQLQREAQQPTEDVDFGGDKVHQSYDHSTLP